MPAASLAVPEIVFENRFRIEYIKNIYAISSPDTSSEIGMLLSFDCVFRLVMKNPINDARIQVPTHRFSVGDCLNPKYSTTMERAR